MSAITATLYAVLTFTVTAYAPAAGGINGDAITADGSHVAMGMAACGPSFAFGTMFDVPGFGVVTCHDRGGWITDRNIDLCIYTGNAKADRAAAMKWGKRRVRVGVSQPVSRSGRKTQ